MNKIELFLLVFAGAILLFSLQRLLNNSRKSLIVTFALLPALFISINKVSQFLTVDAAKYIYRFVDLSKLPEIWGNSVLHVYKILLTITGSVFLLIPSTVKESLGSD